MRIEIPFIFTCCLSNHLLIGGHRMTSVYLFHAMLLNKCVEFSTARYCSYTATKSDNCIEHQLNVFQAQTLYL